MEWDREKAAKAYMNTGNQGAPQDVTAIRPKDTRSTATGEVKKYDSSRDPVSGGRLQYVDTTQGSTQQMVTGIQNFRLNEPKPVVPVTETEITPQQPAPHAARGLFGDVWSGFARGVAKAVERGGRGLQVADLDYADDEGFFDVTGKKIQQFGEKLGKAESIQADEAQQTGTEGLAKRTAITAAESTPGSLLPIAGAGAGAIAGGKAGAVIGSIVAPGVGTAIGGGIGGVVGGALGLLAPLLLTFGGGTYQESRERAAEHLHKTQPNLTADQVDEQSHEYGMKHAEYEVLTEALGDVVAMATFGSGKLLFNLGKAGVKQTVKSTLALGPKEFAKKFAKAYVTDMPFEAGSEMVAYYGQSKADVDIGLGEGATMEGYLEAAATAAWMSGGMGLGIQGYSTVKANRLANQLNDTNNQKGRQDAANEIASGIQDEKVQRQWHEEASKAIAQGDVIDLSEELVTFAAQEREAEQQPVDEQGRGIPDGGETWYSSDDLAAVTAMPDTFQMDEREAREYTRLANVLPADRTPEEQSWFNQVQQRQGEKLPEGLMETYQPEVPISPKQQRKQALDKVSSFMAGVEAKPEMEKIPYGTTPEVDYISDENAKKFNQQRNEQRAEAQRAEEQKEYESLEQQAVDEEIPAEIMKGIKQQAEADHRESNPVVAKMTEAIKGEGGGINSALAREIFGVDTINPLIKQRPGLFTTTGRAPDDMAKSLGYADARDMIADFQAAPTLQQEKNRIVKEGMEQHYIATQQEREYTASQVKQAAARKQIESDQQAVDEVADFDIEELQHYKASIEANPGNYQNEKQVLDAISKRIPELRRQARKEKADRRKVKKGIVKRKARLKKLSGMLRRAKRVQTRAAIRAEREKSNQAVQEKAHQAKAAAEQAAENLEQEQAAVDKFDKEIKQGEQAQKESPILKIEGAQGNGYLRESGVKVALKGKGLSEKDYNIEKNEAGRFIGVHKSVAEKQAPIEEAPKPNDEDAIPQPKTWFSLGRLVADAIPSVSTLKPSAAELKIAANNLGISVAAARKALDFSNFGNPGEDKGFGIFPTVTGKHSVIYPQALKPTADAERGAPAAVSPHKEPSIDIGKSFYHTTDYSEFDTEVSQLGVHFGSKEQASSLRADSDKTGYQYIVEVNLDLKNPLRMVDKGHWDAVQLLDALGVSEAVKKEVTHDKNGKSRSTKEKMSRAKDIAKARGYDGIVYLNRSELAKAKSGVEGHMKSDITDAEFIEMTTGAEDSYIAFDSGQIKEVGRVDLRKRPSAPPKKPPTDTDQAAAAEEPSKKPKKGTVSKAADIRKEQPDVKEVRRNLDPYGSGKKFQEIRKNVETHTTLTSQKDTDNLPGSTESLMAHAAEVQQEFKDTEASVVENKNQLAELFDRDEQKRKVVKVTINGQEYKIKRPKRGNRTITTEEGKTELEKLENEFEARGLYSWSPSQGVVLNIQAVRAGKADVLKFGAKTLEGAAEEHVNLMIDFAKVSIRREVAREKIKDDILPLLKDNGRDMSWRDTGKGAIFSVSRGRAKKEFSGATEEEQKSIADELKVLRKETVKGKTFKKKVGRVSAGVSVTKALAESARDSETAAAIQEIEDLAGEGIKFSEQATANQLPANQQANVSQELESTKLGKRGVQNLVRKGLLKIVDAATADSIIADFKAGRVRLQKAWHGTPHDVDKFRMDKIGTGEGAQAFGHGLYFTDERSIAEYYQKVLSGDSITIDGKPLTQKLLGSYGDSEGGFIWGWIERNGHYLDDSAGKFSTILDNDVYDAQEDFKEAEADGDYSPATLQNIKNRRDSLLTLQESLDYQKNTGNLYQVDLAPKQDEYLLWDKPLSEQSDLVQEALSVEVDKRVPAGIQEKIKRFKGQYHTEKDKPLYWTGEQWYYGISNDFDSNQQQQASEHLLSLGIKGIKYPAGTLSGVDSDKSNYVIFDESDVKIEIRYAKDGSGIIEGFLLPNSNTVHMVQGNIKKGESYSTLLHETGHQFLPKTFTGKQWNRLTSMFDRHADKDTETGKAIQRAKDRVPASTQAANVVEEELMYFLTDQANVNLPLYKRIYSYIKRALVKLGLPTTILNPNDIKLMVQGHLDAMARMGERAGRQAAPRPTKDVRQAMKSMAAQLGVTVQQLQREFDATKKKLGDKISIAPNGKKSNLNDYLFIMTRTPRFTEWFGDFVNDPAGASKVVDSNGDPLVVYHWSLGDFSEFKTITDKNELGAHFGSISAAEDRSGSVYKPYLSQEKIFPTFIRIKKPIYANDQGSWHFNKFAKIIPKNISKDFRAIEKNNSSKIISIWKNRKLKLEEKEKAEKVINWQSIRELKKLFANAGIDGVIYHNEHEGHDNSYSVFEPTQIKSIYNPGAFDPTEADIMKSGTAPEWYSRLANLVKDFNVKKQPATAWVNTFNSWKKKKLPPALQEELEWTGILDILKGMGKQKVTKGEVLDMLESGGVRVETKRNEELPPVKRWYIKYGDELSTHYSSSYDTENEARKVLKEYEEEGEFFIDPDWTEEEAREAFEEEFQEDKEDAVVVSFLETETGEDYIEWEDQEQYSDNTLPNGENYREILISLPKVPGEDYTPTHFSDTKNLLVHVRVDERQTEDGDSVLFVNEVQSDYAKDAREKKLDSIPEAVKLKESILVLQKKIDDLKKDDDYNRVDGGWGALTQEVRLNSEVEQDVDNLTTELNKLKTKWLEFLPDAPFIKSDTAWSMLGTKKAITEAVNSGQDYLAWPATPEQVYEIEQWGEVIEEKDEKTGQTRYKNQDGTGDVTAIVNRYLKDIPRNMNRFLKSQMKIKQKVGRGTLDDGQYVNMIEITPEIKAKVAGQGMPLFSYAGKQAETADKSALARAVKMEQAGVDTEQIRQETGWFMNEMDKKWRFEIGDEGAKLLHGSKGKLKSGGTYNLSDVFFHKELFDAYPELKNTVIEYDAKNKGDASYYKSGGNHYIYVNKKGINAETILHEIQHSIQRIEGFGRGGSPAEFTQQRDAKLARDALSWAREIKKELKKLDTKSTAQARSSISLRYMENDIVDWLPSIEAMNLGEHPHTLYPDKYPKELGGKADLKELVKLYRLDVKVDPQSGLRMYESLAGEIEARDTAGRRKLTPKQRKATTPYVAQGIPKEDAIVRFDGEVAQSVSATDQAYMQAVESGDMETAQRMVDKAAKAAGYDMLSYHGTSTEWNTFDMDKAGTVQTQDFGKGIYLTPPGRVDDTKMYARTAAERTGEKGRIIPLYVKINNPIYGNSWADEGSNLTLSAMQRGKDGVIIKHGSQHEQAGEVVEVIALNPNQIKSAEAVTKDDQGNVIPLSERFQSDQQDIRFSVGTGSKTIKLKSGSTTVTVYQNPDSLSYQTISAEFKERYPYAQKGTPKYRSTEDAEGNTYLWAAESAMHSTVEEHLFDNYGIISNQAGDFNLAMDRNGWTAEQAVKNKTEVGSKESIMFSVGTESAPQQRQRLNTTNLNATKGRQTSVSTATTGREALKEISEPFKKLDKDGHLTKGTAATAWTARVKETASWLAREITGQAEPAPETGAQKARRRRQEKKIKGRAKEAISAVENSILSWEFILNKITAASGKGTLKSKAVTYLGSIAHAGKRNKEQYDRESMDAFQAKAAEIFGIPQETGKVKRALGAFNKLTKKLESFSRNQQDIRAGKEIYTITPVQAAYWQQVRKDQDSAKLFRDMGFTEQTWKDIDTMVPKDLKEWSDWLNDSFVANANTAEGKEERSIKGVTPANKGLDWKIKGQLDIPAMSLHDAALNRVLTSNHSRAWAAPSKLFNDLFSDPTIKGYVEQHHGQSTGKAIKHFLEDFQKAPHELAGDVKVLDRLRANVVTAMIGANPTTFFKQLTSIPAYAADIPTADFIKNFAWGTSHPKAVIQMLKDSGMAKDRFGKGYERDIRDISKTTSEQMVGGVKSVKDILMMGTKLGDMMAVAGGVTVYKYWYDKSIKEGKNKKQSKEIATERFEMATERTQQSGQMSDIGWVQRHSSMYKLFTMFLTAPAAYTRQTTAAIRGFKDDPKDSAKRLLLFNVMLPMMFQAVASGMVGALGDDEEEKDDFWAKELRAVAMGPFLGIPIMRDLASGIWESANGKWYGSDISHSPVTEVGKSLTQAIYAGSRGLATGDPAAIKRAERDFTHFVGYMAGLPTKPMQRLMEGWEDLFKGETEHELLAASGYSRAARNERKKKKKLSPGQERVMKRLRKRLARAKDIGNRTAERRIRRRMYDITG